MARLPGFNAEISLGKATRPYTTHAPDRIYQNPNSLISNVIPSQLGFEEEAGFGAFEEEAGFGAFEEEAGFGAFEEEAGG
jgi:hypothetical protein